MPKSRNSAKAQPSTLPVEEEEVPNQHEESTSSDQKFDGEVPFHTIRQQAPPYFPPNMFMPYIEGLLMDWTVNDGLYHRFLKLRLKCKKHIRLQTCSTPWMSKMQESCNLERGLLDGPVLCPGACPRKTLAWTQFGSTLKNFASPKWMK